MLHLLEITETFPNRWQPWKGTHIFNYLRAVSRHCKITVVVLLRYVPPRELWSHGIAGFPKRFSHWYGSLRRTQDFYDGNLRVLYTPYVSLLRPRFEYPDLELVDHLLFRKIIRLLDDDTPDIVRCHWINPATVLASHVAHYYRVPFVLDHHEPLAPLRVSQEKNYVKMLASMQKADLVLVHSEMNRKALETEFRRNNLSTIRVEKVHLGQNFDISRRAYKANGDLLTLLTISDFTEPDKNVEVLIRAMAVVQKEMKSGVCLFLVGYGEKRKAFERLANDLGLGRQIIFTGYQSHEELKTYFDRSDIFVFPSRMESFGLVVPEALANGLPVIACKGIGAVEEILPLGDCILPVEPDSVEQLSTAIIQLARDPERRKEMGEVGSRIAAEYFTWDQSASSTCELMVRMLQERQEYVLEGSI